jgi:hypothetical protein
MKKLHASGMGIILTALAILATAAAGFSSVQAAGVAATPTALPTTAATATPTGSSDVIGPELEDFPSGYSPLTGLPVSNPGQLKYPAVLVSLSNFPPSVRPQTGLSMAPQVYEIYITEGMTRFLTVFYGDMPASFKAPVGDEEVRTAPLSTNEPILGNRVWLDSNQNGLQDSNESGIGGVKVTLLDSKGKTTASITTDGNGYYGFAAELNQTYSLQIKLPQGYNFTKANAGSNDAQDSDVDPETGKTVAIKFTAQTLDWDAGLIQAESPQLTPTGDAGEDAQATATPAALGPQVQTMDSGSIEGVRSGREAYVPIVNAFPNGCLVAASKAAEVNVNICRTVYNQDANNVNAAGLSLTQLADIAKANQNPNRLPNYSGNAFSAVPPAGGQPALKLEVFYSYLNQSYWQYDAAAGGYMRYEDFADPNRVGQFQLSTDRLTGQPLTFENVVVLFVEHEVRTPTIIDLNMGQSLKGKAIVFRNGQVYQDVYWSTMNENYEQTTGLTRPIRLRYADGTPFNMAPGNTWFHVATPFSSVWSLDDLGNWRYRYYAPEGTK